MVSWGWVGAGLSEHLPNVLFPPARGMASGNGDYID